MRTFRNQIIYYIAYLMIINLLAMACQTKSEQFLIQQQDFGKLPNGEVIKLYTLRNQQGMEVKITNYGGIITHWTAPDRTGKYEDVVLGYDSLTDYLKFSPYFGAIIGRYCNRIAKGKFSLAGKEYTLAVNNGDNHLHGGEKGFDQVVWQAEPIEGAEPALKLTYLSRDGEEGYPGNLQTEVMYTLKNDNSLSIDYQAITDKTTIVNLTNHSYFNLLGNVTADILNHELTLQADKFLPVDSTLIPTGELRPVRGTEFDFTQSTRIGMRINDQQAEQIKFGGGYDHCWVLNPSKTALKLAGQVFEPLSGRVLEIFTTEPAIQFYTGNFLDGTIKGKRGSIYQHRYGFCLETQHYPDSPNQKAFPTTVLEPQETYKTTTIYKFSTK